MRPHELMCQVNAKRPSRSFPGFFSEKRINPKQVKRWLVRRREKKQRSMWFVDAIDTGRSTFSTACCWRFPMHLLRTNLGYRRAPRLVGGEPNFPNIETKPSAGHLQLGADTLGVHRLCWLPLTATCTCRADGWVERHETLLRSYVVA